MPANRRVRLRPRSASDRNRLSSVNNLTDMKSWDFWTERTVPGQLCVQ